MEMTGRAGLYNLCADAGYKGEPARMQSSSGTIGVSFENTEASYVVLLSLACAMIRRRQTVAIYG